MKTYNFARTNETLYYDELKNGFKVYVVPTTNKDSFYAVIGVFYGSNDISFIPNGQTEYKETNLGIAHYLEHLAFATEEGEDPFSFFSKSGVNTNASTSFLSTKYYIWGNNDLKNNLDYLLNFVLTPYFTDENIKKELGVITEEIRMYEDEPNWVIDDLARKMAFKELPLKEKISGTYESIQKITKEELYDCYNTFYAPDNMFLIVSGNVSEKEVFDLVKNHKKLNSLLPKGKVKRKEYDEINEVVSEYKETKMNICLPKMKYLFKVNVNDFKYKDEMKLNMYLNIMIAIIFGPTSEFYEKVRNENIANSYFVDCTKYDKHYLIEFTAETDKADVFKDLVDDYKRKINILENDFIRIKRTWIASEIRLTDYEDVIAESIFDDLITYGKVCTDRIEIIDSLKLEELNKIIKNINWDNSSFILLNPTEEND